MVRIKVLTDSTADLSADQARTHGITVVPLNVHFGDEVYKDGVDMTPALFFKKLRESGILPRTSQPSVGEFLEVYKGLAKEAEVIVSVHISGQLSGTIGSASAARDMLDADITIVDSKSASQGLARCAMRAADAAAAGKSKEEVLALLERLIPQTAIFFCADTLEYLQKNGRIGRAQALLGSLLQIKPILTVDRDGVVAPYDKVRGRSRIVERLLSAAKERVPAGSKVDVSVIHAEAEPAANALLEQARQAYDVRDGYVGPIGPVIGSHIGPGMIGIVVQPTEGQ